MFIYHCKMPYSMSFCCFEGLTLEIFLSRAGKTLLYETFGGRHVSGCIRTHVPELCGGEVPWPLALHCMLLAYVRVWSSNAVKDHMSGGSKARVRLQQLDAVGKNLIESR